MRQRTSTPMSTSFDPTEHPRGSAGRFATKPQSRAEVKIAAGLRSEEAQATATNRTIVTRSADWARQLMSDLPGARYAFVDDSDQLSIRGAKDTPLGSTENPWSDDDITRLERAGLADRRDEGGYRLYLSAAVHLDETYRAEH